MRNLSSDTQIKCGTSLGTQPLVVIRVVWPSGVAYYADRDYDLGGVQCAGKILDLGAIASVRKSVSSGEASSVSLTLDDSDGSIKSIVDRHALEGVAVEVYHQYSDLVAGDKTLLFSGRIANGFNWSEGERKISFTIDMVPRGKTDVGFAPTGVELPGISKSAAGVAWPLCFGTVVGIKAIQPYEPVRGETLSSGDDNSTELLISNGNDYEQGTSQDILVQIHNDNSITTSYPSTYSMDRRGVPYNADSAFRYTTMGFINSIQGMMKLRGTFAGNLFTVTEKNLPFISGVTILPRTNLGSDINNPACLQLDTANTANADFLVGTYHYINIAGYKAVNFCVGRIGDRYYYAQGWKINNALAYLPEGGYNQIAEVAGHPRTEWGITYNAVVYQYDGSETISATVGPAFKIDYGATVTSILQGSLKLHVCNLIPSTEILGVYAYRTFQGKKALWPVPSRWYTKHLSYSLAGKTPTVIEMLNGTIEYGLHGWEKDIYVALRSSVGSNTADQLKYIIENYSDYAVDNGSYSGLRAALTRYPSNWALTTVKTCIPLCEEIAYQARSAVNVTGDSVKFQYLSIEPAAQGILTTENVEVGTLSIGSVEELSTRYIAKWKRNLLQEADQQIKIEHNIALYGEKEESKEFYIYCHESLVKLSAHFWAWRTANSWRTAQCSGFLTNLGTEAFDTLSLSINSLSNNSIKALVTNMSLDTKESVVGLTFELASLSDAHDSGNQPLQSPSYWSGDPAYPITNQEAIPPDPGAGWHELDYQPASEPPPYAPPTDQTRIVSLLFRDLPEDVTHGQAFTFILRTEYEDGSVAPVNGPVDLTLHYTKVGFTPSAVQVTLVNGVAGVTLTVTGTGLDGGFTINANAQGNQYQGVSPTIRLWGMRDVVFTTPAIVERNMAFDFSITGEPSTTYTVTFTTTDTVEKLYFSTQLVSIITTGVDGTYTGSMKIKDGSLAINNTSITLTASGREYTSPSISVMDIDSSINLVITATAGAYQAGDVVMNGGSGWVLAANNDNVSFGIVGRIANNVAYIVVRGLVCIPGITPHTNYYCLSGGMLINTGDTGGKFVLRSYENSLCWVGGGSAIAKLTDIGDVAKDTLTDKDILQWNAIGKQWVKASLTTIDQSLQITDWFDFKIRDKGVTFAKIEDMDGYSVLGRIVGTAGTPIDITAYENHAVLTRSESQGGLGFRLLANANILDAAAIAWTKISKVGASLVDIPGAAAYIDGRVVAGQQPISISIAMNVNQGIAHSDNTTGAKIGTAFTLGFFPFTAKGQISICNGNNPVNGEYAVTSLNFPIATERNAVLVADTATGIPKWTKTLEIGDTTNAGATFKAWWAAGKYISTDSAGKMLSYAGVTKYVEMSPASGFKFVPDVTYTLTMDVSGFKDTSGTAYGLLDSTQAKIYISATHILTMTSTGFKHLNGTAYGLLDSAQLDLLGITADRITLTGNTATGLFWQSSANQVAIYGETGKIQNTRGSVLFDVCDVATFTTSKTVPSVTGKKGQLHFIY